MTTELSVANIAEYCAAVINKFGIAIVFSIYILLLLLLLLSARLFAFSRLSQVLQCRSLELFCSRARRPHATASILHLQRMVQGRSPPERRTSETHYLFVGCMNSLSIRSYLMIVAVNLTRALLRHPFAWTLCTRRSTLLISFVRAHR